MPKKIGKYEVLERIGRGGMGTIFKAHDPVLDRLVALKVISSEVEVTDELRARFFREAQACARLSHRNIVTVYDMGEHDGRLFIVMELLDGEELRRLISQRKALALEDKLAIMAQVCDGLHYAHQKGIVHRDIKPGNIFVLRSGQVKILDFGIARIATTEGDLTRTGLIMGSLRYISPEQARGRADYRSDMFSAGAVFYELLSLRPPFTGEDPMQILEQLRTEEPPSLTEIDPGIPPDLAAIIKRAMRKDPAARFADLEQMRDQLEQVQRGLTDEVQRVRARVREQRDQLGELRVALAERIGPAKDDEAIPAVDERGRLATMRALQHDLAARIDDMHAKIAQADVLAPALQRGLELLAAGECADAVVEFEAIVGDMPEHAHAVEGLGQARARVEAERRRQLASQLVRDARGALDDGAYALCLEILKQAAEIPPPAEAAAEIASLREAAEGALAAQEAARRMRQQAERAREQMGQGRRTAVAYAATTYAAELWEDAEAKATEGEAAFARETYADAQEAFKAADAGYRRFEAAAREAELRDRDAAERAREQMAQGRERAQAAGAQQYPREQWDVAEAKAAEAQAAFGNKALGRAAGVSDEASVLDGRDEEAAPEARQHEDQRVEEKLVRAAPGQRGTEAADAPREASALLEGASARPTPAQPASPGVQGAEAAEASGEALAPRAALAEDAHAQGQERRAEAGQPSEGAVARQAQVGGAAARPADGRARGLRYLAPSLAAGLLLALVGYWLYAPPPGGPSLADLRSTVVAARERAVRAEANALALDAFSGAQAKAAEGDRLSAARNPGAAAQAYREAAERYGDAERQARVERQVQIEREARVEADTARDRMIAVKQRARPDAADFAAALAREREGNSMYERLAFKEAATTFHAAAELFARVPPVQDPPKAPPVQDPRAEIRAVLNDYVRAVEAKDLALLRRVRSGLTDDEVRRMRASFEITRSHKVALRVYEITVSGDEAQAVGRREDVVVLNSGQRLDTETRFAYTLKRGPRGWAIHGLRESAERRPVPPPPRQRDSGG